MSDLVELRDPDGINPGELVRWTNEDGDVLVGYLAGVGEGYSNCVTADGIPHPGISNDKVGRR